MEQVAATRSELLARRARLELAMRGRMLLEEKRDQLMEEFRKAADLVLAEVGQLEGMTADGRRALAFAEAAEGPEQVRAAARAADRDLALSGRSTTIAGVRIAEIDFEPLGRGRFERGYEGAGGSAHVDRAADEYEAVVEQLLRVAAYELRLRRLSEEIGTTNRRVNALATIVIPQLQGEVRLIQSRLEERERQEIYRLKRIKERKGSRLEEVAA
jgi:V/A-type H+-transporting ATPase subunit D